MSNELERVARALNLAGWTCSDGAHEPGNYDTCAQCRRVCNNGAHIAIAAMTTPQVHWPAHSTSHPFMIE